MRRIKKQKIIRGFPLVLSYLPFVLMVIGLLECLPLINIFFYPEEISDLYYWLIPGGAAFIVGLLGNIPFLRYQRGEISNAQGMYLVLIVWVLAIFMFSIPWMASGQMDFTRAIFECTSGFTTTGMTTCDVANTSHVFLFSRSLMTWSGGAGLVLILTLAGADKSGATISNIEGHSDKLLPNISKSSRTVFLIYIGFTIVGSLALWIVGLPIFDAINICMSSISTGGFAVDPSSLVCYNNVLAEIIVSLLAATGATNFLFHFFFFKGDFKKAFLNYEFIVGCVLFVVFGGLLIGSFALQENNFGLGLRYGLFQYFTAMTGAGFVNTATPMMQLSPVLILLTIFVMALGGQSGSTAGGIKHFRIAYICIGFKDSIKSKVSSKNLIHTHFVHKFGNKSKVTPEDTFDATSYALLYIVVAFVGGFIISLCKDQNGNNYGALESFFEFLSCLGTTGLSSGITCATTPKLVLWVESFGMFFGRLELTILFLSLYSNLKNIVNIHNDNTKSVKLEE